MCPVPLTKCETHLRTLLTVPDGFAKVAAQSQHVGNVFPGFSAWGGVWDPGLPHQGQEATGMRGGRWTPRASRGLGRLRPPETPSVWGAVGKWGPAGSPPPAEALLGRPVQPQCHLVVLPGTAA